jgi:hypothetical protein
MEVTMYLRATTTYGSLIPGLEYMLLTALRRRRYIIEMMRRVDSSLRAGILSATEKANLILYRGVA